jgi:hypothetical protein
MTRDELRQIHVGVRNLARLVAASGVIAVLAIALLPARAQAADAREALRNAGIQFLRDVKSGRIAGSLDVSRNGTKLAGVELDAKFDFSRPGDPRMQYTVQRVGWGSGPATVTLRNKRVYVKVFNGTFFGTAKAIRVRYPAFTYTDQQKINTIDLGLQIASDFRDEGEQAWNGQTLHFYSALFDLDNIVELVAPAFGALLPDRCINVLGTDTQTVKFIEQYISGNLPRFAFGIDAGGLARGVSVAAQSNDGQYRLDGRFDITQINEAIPINAPKRAKKVRSRARLNKLIRKGTGG